MRLLGGVLAATVVVSSVSCRDVDPCGLLSSTTTLDLPVTSGADASCTVVIARGTSSISVDLAAPTPAPPSASPDAGFVYDLCDSDAGARVVVTPDSFGVDAWRSANELCIRQTGLAYELGLDSSDCAVSVTLTCGGVTLVNAMPWSVCIYGC